MRLDSAERKKLIADILAVVPNHIDFKNLVAGVRVSVWVRVVQIPTTPEQAVTAIVEDADQTGWIGELVAALSGRYPQRPEFAALLAALDREQTVADPFEEVLLPGNKPFVNRKAYRMHLQNMTDPRGARVLHLDGDDSSGKSFSYYLLNHAAPRRGFAVHKFVLDHMPTPYELADEVLRRLGESAPQLPALGTESAERWAIKLAHEVKRVIEARGTPRFFVFDQFPTAGLPPETLSFIARLATFCEEELHALLRIVLVMFPGQLPPDVEDWALRDSVQPFSGTEMVDVIMQVASARQWDVTAPQIKTHVDQFLQSKPSLRDCSKFVTRLITALNGGVSIAGVAAPAGSP